MMLVALVAALPLAHAQDADSDNPDGPSGSYNAQSSTGGPYDPFTSSAKRTVTDLVVPNSALAFTRFYNSRLSVVADDHAIMGDGSNWRHSYQWALAISETLQGVGYRYPNAYNVAYPDGSVVTFRSYRNHSPENNSPYWHGPRGVQDRLYVVNPTSSRPDVTLLLADGSQVIFAASSTSPQYMLDPHKAVTTFTYGPGTTPYLTQITEPGGRWLQLAYATIQSGSNVWIVLDHVTASTGQVVHYNYVSYTSGRTKPYYALSRVDYNSEPLVSNNGVVTAYYDYQTNGSIPDLIRAYDPHYAGAMVGIHYLYSSPGYLQAEQNYAATDDSTWVARLSRDNNANISTEKRGDKATGGADITRTFTYGQSSFVAADGTTTVTTGARTAQPTSMTDFEGNVSHLTYDAYLYANNAYDAKGVKTGYVHEPLAGKITTVILPDNSQQTWVWQGMDGSTTNVNSNGTANPSYPYYLLRSTNERGQNTIYYRYSNTGLIYRIDYPTGTQEFFNYQGFSANGNTFYKVSFHQDQRGAQIFYAYDEPSHGGSGFPGLLTTVTRNYADGDGNPHSEPTKLIYDGWDRLTQSVDPQNVTEQFGYNARHQLVQNIHPGGSYGVYYYYDDVGNRYAVRDELGHVAYTYYDEYRRVVNLTTPVNAPKADGTLIPNRAVAFAYDRRDNSDISIADALSHTASNWSVNWTSSGRASQRIFSKNNWLTDQYDGMYANVGYNPVLPQPVTGYTHSSATYNPLGQLKSSTDPQGFLTKLTYDTSNRLATTSDAMGASGHVTTQTYFPVGQYAGLPASTTFPGADAVGFPVATTQSTSYDVMGRLLTTHAPPNNGSDPYNTFDQAFTPTGELTSLDDGAQAQGGHVTGYETDQLGRRSRLRYPDGTFEKWTYDPSGNVRTYKNRAAALCTYSYDARNRCNGLSWSANSAPAVTYEYDDVGRVTRVNNGFSDLRFTYDESGAVRTESALRYGVSPPLVTTYTYDLDGRVDSILYPSGYKPVYSYDQLGRCTGVVVNGTPNASYSYQGARLTSRTLPSCGLSTNYGYQSNGRLSWWQHRRTPPGGSTFSLRLQYYGYAPDGQVSWTCRYPGGDQSGRNSALDNGQGDAYYYYPDGSLNAAYRNVGVPNCAWPALDSATLDARVDTGQFVYYGGAAPSVYEGYSFDAAGNRHTGPLGTYPVADAENRYPNGGNYDYDANGNAKTLVPGWTCTYNANGQLTQALGPGGAQALYFDYDGLGRLSGENVNNVLKTYFYAGSQRIEERTSTGGLLYQYIFDGPGSDQIFCRHDATNGNVWYLYDALGNVTHIANDAGGVVEQYLYDAWGTPSVYDAAGVRRPGGSLYDNRYLFKAGGAYQWYAAAGLYYCRARFYLPLHGRWLQPDPIGQAGGLNLYAYCGNDPVNGSDPSGLLEKQADGGNIHAGDTFPLPDGIVGRIEGVYPINSQQRGVETFGGGGLDHLQNGSFGMGGFGGSRDPLADPHGTRNFFAGIVGSTVHNLFEQAHALANFGTDPLGIVNAQLNLIERGVNSVGNSLAGQLGIDPSSQSYVDGTPGGWWAAAALTLLLAERKRKPQKG